jgi:hypothetical protein
MAVSLFFASCYFSVMTPQGGSQNVMFVGSGLSHATRTLSTWAAHNALLSSGIPDGRDRLADAGHPMIAKVKANSRSEDETQAVLVGS